jgi:hypothetical protein
LFVIVLQIDGDNDAMKRLKGIWENVLEDIGDRAVMIKERIKSFIHSIVQVGQFKGKFYDMSAFTAKDLINIVEKAVVILSASPQSRKSPAIIFHMLVALSLGYRPLVVVSARKNCVDQFCGSKIATTLRDMRGMFPEVFPEDLFLYADPPPHPDAPRDILKDNTRHKIGAFVRDLNEAEKPHALIIQDLMDNWRCLFETIVDGILRSYRKKPGMNNAKWENIPDAELDEYLESVMSKIPVIWDEGHNIFSNTLFHSEKIAKLFDDNLKLRVDYDRQQLVELLQEFPARKNKIQLDEVCERLSKPGTVQLTDEEKKCIERFFDDLTPMKQAELFCMRLIGKLRKRENRTFELVRLYIPYKVTVTATGEDVPMTMKQWDLPVHPVFEDEEKSARRGYRSVHTFIQCGGKGESFTGKGLAASDFVTERPVPDGDPDPRFEKYYILRSKCLNDLDHCGKIAPVSFQYVIKDGVTIPREDKDIRSKAKKRNKMLKERARSVKVSWFSPVLEIDEDDGGEIFVFTISHALTRLAISPHRSVSQSLLIDTSHNLSSSTRLTISPHRHVSYSCSCRFPHGVVHRRSRLCSSHPRRRTRRATSARGRRRPFRRVFWR